MKRPLARARLNVASIGVVGVSGEYAVRFEHALMARAVAATAVAFHKLDIIRLLFLGTRIAPDRTQT